jgi:hypothetical protein
MLLSAKTSARHSRRAYPLRGLRSPVVVRLKYGEHSNVPPELAPALQCAEALAWVRVAMYEPLRTCERPTVRNLDAYWLNYRLTVIPRRPYAPTAENLDRVRALLAVLVGLPAGLWDQRLLGSWSCRWSLEALAMHETHASCSVARFVLERFP